MKKQIKDTCEKDEGMAVRYWHFWVLVSIAFLGVTVWGAGSYWASYFMGVQPNTDPTSDTDPIHCHVTVNAQYNIESNGVLNLTQEPEISCDGETFVGTTTP